MARETHLSDSTYLITEELALPETAITHAGFEFIPQDELWSIVDQSVRWNADFFKLKPYCTASLIQAFKMVLVHYLTNKSATHSKNIFNLFLHFARTIGLLSDTQLSIISSASLLNYKGYLPQNQMWYLTSLSGLFKKWHELGYPGVDPEIPVLLRQLRLKGNKKGVAVLTMDPHEGPFTEIELQALYGALNDAYAQGRIGTRPYVLAWLFMALGARNVQIASLKIKDFVVQRASGGASTYLLNVPRAKQRGSFIRDQFKSRPLIQELGELIEVWIEQIKLEYSERIDDGIDPEELPIFPAWNTSSPIGFEHHTTGANLGAEIKQIFKKLKVASERTGKQIKVNARRFRYTLGTRAAMEGHGELVIAELLDHSDTQQVGVYVEATPEIIDRIDNAIALELAPLAQAFSGMIVTDEWEAERGDDPTSQIRSPNTDPEKGAFGTCGKYGFCGAYAPIACYTCRNFQAWLDGPHEEVLNDLIAERERRLEETGDERFAFTNDRTILAVAEVIRRCKEIRHHLEAE